MFSYHSTDQTSAVTLINAHFTYKKTYPDFSIEMYEKLQNLYCCVNVLVLFIAFSSYFLQTA